MTFETENKTIKDKSLLSYRISVKDVMVLVIIIVIVVVMIIVKRISIVNILKG